MSSVQSVLALLQPNDYLALATATAVIYDYCLTISNEVTYIWKRPWTRVSTLFLLIRYVGCFSALITAFDGSVFIPGPVKVRHSSSEFLSLSPQTANTSNDIRPVSISNNHPRTGTKFAYFRGYMIYVLNGWAHAIFYMAADMVMILRVYAMYNRSKIILSVLLMMYLTEVVILFVGGGFYSDPKYDKASVVLSDIAVCSVALTTQTWNIAAVTIQCILGTVLCILAVAQFVRDSVQMYQESRVWQPNRYIGILTRDGLFYFLATLFYALATVLSNTQSSIRQRSGTLLAIAIANVLLYTLTPRFVINVRELYTLDSHGHLNGDIDTGFGLTSGGARGVGGSTTIDTIAFVEAGATRALEDGEGTAMIEERAESSNSEVLVI